MPTNAGGILDYSQRRIYLNNTCTLNCDGIHLLTTIGTIGTMNMKHTIRCPLCSDEKCVNNKATEGNDTAVELIDSNDIIDLKADKNKNVLYAFLTILLWIVLLVAYLVGFVPNN